jgi:hypothetical protein
MSEHLRTRIDWPRRVSRTRRLRPSKAGQEEGFSAAAHILYVHDPALPDVDDLEAAASTGLDGVAHHGLIAVTRLDGDGRGHPRR